MRPISIIKIEEVMKKIVMMFLMFTLLSFSINAQVGNKKYEIGIGPGILFPSQVYISLYDGYVNQKTNFLLRSYFDYYLIPQLTFGFYVNYTNTNLEKDISIFGYKVKKSGTSILEFGGSIKPKFDISPQFIFKPGVSLGQRQYFGDESFSKWKGLALDGSFELQYLISRKYKLFAELGFLYQPYGGNKDTDVTFDPNPYLVMGIVF